MAETRKFDGTASVGIQKMVREALGENVRPVHPSDKPRDGAAIAQPADERSAIADLGDGPAADYLFYGPSGQ